MSLFNNVRHLTPERFRNVLKILDLFETFVGETSTWRYTHNTDVWASLGRDVVLHDPAKGKAAVGLVQVLGGRNYMRVDGPMFRGPFPGDPKLGEFIDWRADPRVTAALIFSDGTVPGRACLILHDARVQSFLCPSELRFPTAEFRHPYDPSHVVLDHGNRLEEQVSGGILRGIRVFFQLGHYDEDVSLIPDSVHFADLVRGKDGIFRLLGWNN